MLIYPQLSNGALAQFPIVKQHRQRTVVNALPDSSSIKLADPYGELTEWELKYTSLSDSEALALQQFFVSTEGSLNVFTFLDPTANLLSWTNQLDNVVWSKDPFLSIAAGVADPTGGTNGWQAGNSGAGAQTITQTLSVPGAYVYSLSVYAQAVQPANITLFCGAIRLSRTLGTCWNRLTLTASGDSSSQSTIFGIEIPAGVTVDIFGLQVEPQASPSVYKPTEIGGVYQNASFRDDTFSFITTDVNHHSATVNIVHANSL